MENGGYTKREAFMFLRIQPMQRTLLLRNTLLMRIRVLAMQHLRRWVVAGLSSILLPIFRLLFQWDFILLPYEQKGLTVFGAFMSKGDFMYLLQLLICR